MNFVSVGLIGAIPPPQPDMNPQVEDPAQEVRRLQRCINDLVSLLALPAVWSGNEPLQIVQILVDALLRMLNLDFICARLKDSVDARLLEVLRISDACKSRIPLQEILGALNSWFGIDGQKSLPAIRHRFGDEDISIVPVSLGVHGESGMIVVGCARLDFPWAN